MPVQASPKRIIVCCDGTWQSSVSGLDNVPSNVTRLTRHLACNGKDAEGNEWNQVVYYDSGVGTGDIGAQSVIQGGSGKGLATNVIEAYNFIVLNYRRGDKIYCFGFSRGAYTARAVAGLVTDIGVLQPRDMQEFPALYHQYQQNNDGDEFRKTQHYYNWVNGIPAEDIPEEVVKHAQEPAEESGGAHQQDLVNMNWQIRPHGEPEPETRFVEVVGVFDTVGSLGIPDLRGIDLSYFRTRYGFHNVKLSPYITNAYHALALDEHRGPFAPTLWYIPYESPIKKTLSPMHAEVWETIKHDHSKPRDEKLAAWRSYLEARDSSVLNDDRYKFEQRLYQVWFPGVHINIGGGSDDLLKDKKGDLEQIANITFCWLAELLRPHLALDMNSMEIFLFERKQAIDRVSRKKNYGAGWMSSYLNHGLEWMNLKTVETYKIDDGVKEGWATGDIEDSYGGLMYIAGSDVRHPGLCLSSDKRKEPLCKLGRTWEFIHPCVEYRKEKLEKTTKKYDPPALKEYNRSRTIKDGVTVGFEWVRHGGGYRWDGKQARECDLRVPEWVIFPTKSEFGDRSFERAAMTTDAHEWVGTLDKVYKISDWWKEAQAMNGK